jgi:hypothetical protein
MITTTEKIPSREWLMGWLQGYLHGVDIKDEISEYSRERLWELYKRFAKI